VSAATVHPCHQQIKMLKLRLISSAVILPPIFGAIWFGGIFFYGLLSLVGALMLLELSNLIGIRRLWLKAVFAASAGLWPFVIEFCETAVVGFFFVSVVLGFWIASNHIHEAKIRIIFLITLLLAYTTLLSLIWIRAISGPEGMLFVVVVIAGTDIGGYFIGRLIGGPKLAPQISPNKTWAGLIGAALTAGVAGAILALTPLSPFSLEGSNIQTMTMVTNVATISVILAAVAQIGDLLESWLKRCCGVKDSGQIIPGHGGVLDRVDGYLTAGPLIALIILYEKGFFVWP